MADVVQKIISGNDIQQGSAVSHVTQTGNIHSLLPNVTNAISISEAEAKWTGRFDDTECYGTKFKTTVISGCQLWLAADKITGLDDGDTVATWSDSTTNGNDFAQSTASKKPLYKTGIFNSKPAIKFDGTDDYIFATVGSAITDVDYHSFFSVFSYISEGHWDTVAAIGKGSASTQLLRYFQLDNLSPRNIRIEGKNAANAVITLARGSDVVVGTPYVGSAITGTSTVQYLNGVSDATHTAYVLDDHDIDTFTLGASTYPITISPAECYVAEAIFYNRQLSEGEQNRVEKYLGKKYGVVIP